MNDAPRPAIGIDIGAAAITVCPATTARPSAWPVTTIQLKETDWPAQLLRLIPPRATVALEPTGWYYSRPIVQVLAIHTDAQVIYIAHDRARAARTDRISSQKTDATDARALALKALDYAAHGSARGAKAPDPALEILTLTLRLHLSDRKRAMKERVAALNRIQAFAHGLWPALAMHPATYLRAISIGATTPAEVVSLAAAVKAEHTHHPPYDTAPARTALHRLAAKIPPLPAAPPSIAAAIQQSYDRLIRADVDICRADVLLEAAVQSPEIAGTSDLWATVPAASPTAIAALHAATNCAAAHMDADQFRAACGCHPSRQESGQVTEARQTKRGYRPAKAGLHLWAMNLLNPLTTPDNPIRRYYAAQVKRGNHNAIHAARGKLCRILSGIARTGTPYRDQPTAQEDAPCP